MYLNDQKLKTYDKVYVPTACCFPISVIVIMWNLTVLVLIALNMIFWAVQSHIQVKNKTISIYKITIYKTIYKEKIDLIKSICFKENVKTFSKKVFLVSQFGSILTNKIPKKRYRRKTHKFFLQKNPILLSCFTLVVSLYKIWKQTYTSNLSYIFECVLLYLKYWWNKKRKTYNLLCCQKTLSQHTFTFKNNITEQKKSRN